MKGDDEGGRVDRPVGRDAGLGECGGVELRGEGLHLRVVDGLQVEQAGARMTRRIRLVAVEAQALAAPLELLGRRQAPEGACRRGGSRSSGRQGGACRGGGRRGGAGRGTRAAARERLLQGVGALLVRACVIHGRLQVLGVAHLDVDADVVGKAADEELGALASRDVRRMAGQRLEAVGEVLHRGGEGKATELGQAAPTYGGPNRRRHRSRKRSHGGIPPSSCSRA